MSNVEQHTFDGPGVKAWNEPISIPTYDVGAPDDNPMFLDKRVYQGSSGAVYPYQMIHTVSDEKRPRTYDAVFLENRYLKIMLLPELGGRVQMAFDKSNDYHFVYYNRVVKPALVGLAGPWISGGIEFNWPQHHRPSTFAPTEYEIRNESDGSAVVWVAEWEKMFRMRSAAGFRLYPERAVLEISGKLSNPTPFPQTFLWWANPAVGVNDHYQAVFPPDVTAVFDHGKRDLSRFPVATDTYYKVDYSHGVDISWYKNVPVPTSYMAYHSDYDFVGGFDHGRNAGILHVADHRVSPGKKMWTWGTSDFGKAWEQNLTDEDGPYIELMTGVYTDNQPDFSWLQPGEEKEFVQHFFPFKGAMPVKAASDRVVFGLDLESRPNVALLHFYATEEISVTATVERYNVIEAQKDIFLTPQKSESWAVESIESPESCLYRIYDKNGQELLRYPIESVGPRPSSKPAVAPPEPHRIASDEELFLWGRHIEQYRHATFSPEPFYREALRRDHRNSRANNALGLRQLKRGNVSAAENSFRTACNRLLERNPNPKDGEPLFNLGVALWYQDKHREAYDWFYKATWNTATRPHSFFFLARIDASRGKLDRALKHLDAALGENPTHLQASHLKTVLLRKLDNFEQAMHLNDVSLRQHPVNYLAHAERMLQTWPGEWPAYLSEKPHLFCEILFSYGHSGFAEDAIQLVNRYIEENETPGPMPMYIKAYYQKQLAKQNDSRDTLEQAEAVAQGTSFPNQLELACVLQHVLAMGVSTPMAAYELGNYYFGTGAPEWAHEQWQYAATRAPRFPSVHRNLALSLHNTYGNSEEAQSKLETALSLQPDNAQMLLELDVLLRRRGQSVRERLDLLEAHRDVVFERDDLCISYVQLLNLAGDSQGAYEILSRRQFHPWEGGEGKVTEQYKRALIQLAKAALDEGALDNAVEFLEAAKVYPRNLGEGKLPTAEADNEIDFWIACAYEAKGDTETREAALSRASSGSESPQMSFYYNDRPADAIFYQALAWRLLGEETNARRLLHRLRDHGEDHIDDHIEIDYFAVSLPDFLVFDEDLDERNVRFCSYLLALGQWGLGLRAAARRNVSRPLESDPAHAGAHFALSLMRQSSTNSDSLTARHIRAATTAPE